MKDIVKIFILIIFLATGKISLAQCNFYNEITVSTSSFNVAYTQRYVAINNDNNLIAYIDNNGIFPSVTPGQYLVYAVNYDGVTPASLAVGSPWSGVVSYSISNCLDIIGPYNSGVINVCDDVCSNQPFSASSSGFHTGGSYSQTYVLVNYPASGNNILASNTTGNFTNADYSGDGVYAIYAVNTEEASVASTLSSPTAWNTTDAAITANCAEAIGPYLIGVGVGNCVLPFEYLTFNGTINNTSNILNWELTSDIEVKNYDVERSENGVDFKKLSTTTSLKHVDYDPLKKLYYRLKIKFGNGDVKYSNIVTLERNDKFSILNIYPNPTQGILTFNIESLESNLLVEIHNTLGQMIKYNRIVTEKGINEYVLDITYLDDAMYFISITDGNTKHIEKITKR